MCHLGISWTDRLQFSIEISLDILRYPYQSIVKSSRLILISIVAAEHRRLRAVPALAQMEPAELAETDQGESYLPSLLHPSDPVRHRGADVRQSHWNRWACERIRKARRVITRSRVSVSRERFSLPGYGCLMILSSVPIYFAFIAWKNKPKFFQQGVGKSQAERHASNVAILSKWSSIFPKSKGKESGKRFPCRFHKMCCFRENRIVQYRIWRRSYKIERHKR